MGNPHPTNSKPFKIGRKHTGKPGLRAIGRKKSRNAVTLKRMTAKRREFSKAASLFWQGKSDAHPAVTTTPEAIPNRLRGTLNWQMRIEEL